MLDAHLILQCFEVYLALGVACALPFLLAGVQRMDRAAAGAWAFRLLALPGCVALWPVLALKLLRSRR